MFPSMADRNSDPYSNMLYKVTVHRKICNLPQTYFSDSEPWIEETFFSQSIRFHGFNLHIFLVKICNSLDIEIRSSWVTTKSKQKLYPTNHISRLFLFAESIGHFCLSTFMTFTEQIIAALQRSKLILFYISSLMFLCISYQLNLCYFTLMIHIYLHSTIY